MADTSAPMRSRGPLALERFALVFAAALAALLASDSAAGAAPRRVALLFAHPDGGPGREALKWVVRDAETLGETLVGLGGVLPEDRILVAPASKDAMLATLRLADLIARTERARGQPIELIVYYSGHASRAGLHLGREVLPFDELRRQILSVDAALTLTILDACASGGVLRDKGGSSAPGFLSAEPALTGRVFLTSASEDELAQESDRLQSSWFTHDLVAAMAGAADYDDDRVVTLTEAYRYAQQATQARSREHRGSQTPSWELDLSGVGDLALTRLAVGRATLVLDARLAGRVTLLDPRGRVVHELEKPMGGKTTLAIPPGSWRLQLVTFRPRPTLREGAFELAPGGTHLARPEDLTLRDIDEARARGGPTTALRLAFLPGLALGGGENPVVHGASLALLADSVVEVRGLQTALFANLAELAVGAQLGGLNQADAVTGAQVGIVNIAGELRGTQLGLINVARRVSGAQLGFFSWVDDGIHHLELGVDTVHKLALGWRIGTRYFHTAVTLGALGWEEDTCHLTLAVGTRIPAGPLTVDLDLGPTLEADRCRPETLGATATFDVRAFLGWQLGEVFGLYLSGRVAFSDESPEVEPSASFGIRLFR